MAACKSAPRAPSLFTLPASAPAPLPAPEPGRMVRISLDQLHEYLSVHGLRVARRVDEAGGGWYVELVAVVVDGDRVTG